MLVFKVFKVYWGLRVFKDMKDLMVAIVFC